MMDLVSNMMVIIGAAWGLCFWGMLILLVPIFIPPVSALYASNVVSVALLSIIVPVQPRGCLKVDSRPTTPIRCRRWLSALVLALLVTLFEAPESPAMQAPQGVNTPEKRMPFYHTIIALDMSDSVIRILPEMMRFIADYAQRFIVTGEEVTLLIFSYDDSGSVKELCSFIVESADSITPLIRAMDDLSVQNYRKTRTYFRPLAEHINGFLTRVRLHPVVLVLSDGISDGFRDAIAGKTDFREIPFESLGTRGIYQIPGVSDWKVAIQGGAGLDFQEIFRKTPTIPKGATKPAKKEVISNPPLGPIVAPCRIDPMLHVTVSDKISFRPDFNPFKEELSALLHVTVRNDCVARFRSFILDVSFSGGEFIPIGKVRQALIDETPKTFASPVILPRKRIGRGDAVVRLRLEQGSSVIPIYADPVQVEILSYGSLYWKHWALWVTALLVPIALVVVGIRILRNRRRSQGMVVTTVEGHTVRLTPHSSITLGGVGCGIPVSNVPAGMQIGSVKWADSNTEVKVRAHNGFRVKINGGPPTEEMMYTLGCPMEFSNPITGSSFDVVLLRGNEQNQIESLFGAPFKYQDPWSQQSSHGFDFSTTNGPPQGPLI